MPPEVVASAAQYLQAHAAGKDAKKTQREFIAGFRAGFKEPFRPDEIEQDSERAFEAGYNAAARYWLRNPERRDEIMAGFGYSKIEAAGLWSLGFEFSQFSSAQGVSCWLDPMFKSVVDVPRSTDLLQHQTLKVSVTGYLSPRGTYGHMGHYSCEIRATSVRRGDA